MLYALLLSYCAVSQAQTVELRYWSGASGRDDYDTELLKMAMDATTDTFGPYTFKLVHKSYGTLRGRRLLAQGDIINIYASPVRPPEIATKEELLVVPIPILKGLLGYRQLLIHKDNVSLFASITTRMQLSQFTAGQGKGWMDASIYRHNGFAVEEPAIYSNLFSMLTRKRFDYLPLGSHEIYKALNENSDKNPSLIIAPKLLIYYPFPVAFHVSKHEPELARRIEVGMKRIIENGQFDALFMQHFTKTLARIRNKDNRTVMLSNPNIHGYPELTTPNLLTTVSPL